MTRSRVETLDAGPVTALAALLDSGTDAPKVGDVLPPLWHWVALPRWSASSTLGPDGHPHADTGLPDTGLPRRMFAGGRIVLHGDLRVGSDVRIDDEVGEVQHKQGRSGPLAVVGTTTRFHDAETGDLLVEEHRDLVFREASTIAVAPTAAPVGPPVGAPLTPSADGRWAVRTDPTLLMRFSAATANAHRIHYDWPYATEVEGYPGLVVHGPLSALLLVEALRLDGRELQAPGTQLTLRNSAPLFCGEPADITLTRGVDDDAVLTTADAVVSTRLVVTHPEEGTP